MLMIFAANSIHFMASKKKIQFLREANQHQDENGVPQVHLYVRNKVWLDTHRPTFENCIAIIYAEDFWNIVIEILCLMLSW